LLNGKINAALSGSRDFTLEAYLKGIVEKSEQIKENNKRGIIEQNICRG